MRHALTSLFFASSLALVALSATALHADDEPATFQGRIVYEQTATGDSDGAKAFRGLAPSKIVVHFGAEAYRQDEVGGMNEGSWLYRRGKPGALLLDHKRRRSVRSGGTDLDAMDDKVKAFMPWHFKTELEKTDETDTICGHAVRRYKVKRSAFVRKGATAYAWIAEGLRLPPSRFQFETETRKTNAPVPLSIPVPTGTILKMEILEAGTPVTIVATEVSAGTPEASLFVKPENYDGDDFPKAPKAVKGSARKPMPKEEIAKLPRTATSAAGMKLTLILPGTFRMGSPADVPNRRDDEAPVQVTIVRPYYIGTHEVTQKQWREVMGSDSPSKFKGDNLPVENITWAQANEFVQKLSASTKQRFRLPTEAEWEYAARAGETLTYKPHSAFKAWLGEHAWYYGTAKYKSHPVGKLKPNAWGLFDMIGNVSEWTSSGYGPYPKEAVSDPLGMDSTQKCVRGGNWVASHDWCRPGSRSTQPAEKGKSTIGLRVVREL